MTHRVDDTTISQVMETLINNGLGGLAEAVSVLMNEAMKLERSGFLQAEPFERTPGRRGYANGFKGKTIRSRLGELGLRIPQVRDTDDGETFYPQALERGLRSERALSLAVAEMYVNGVSTRRVKEITRELCGLDVSSADVSRAAALLDEELESWRTRSLGKVPYLVLDARYEKVRHGGQVVSCAVLVAVGVLGDGRRSVLGVSVALSEAEVHWREFLSSLMERGLHGVRLVVSDDHEGLKKARRAVLPSVPWQRCQFHLQQNAGHYVPRVAMRREVAAAIRAFDMLMKPSPMLEKLVENTKYFREKMTGAGFDIVPGTHPIVPVMLGDAKLANDMSRDMLSEGIYVVGFSHPVVPMGKARIRVQLSAAHSKEHIDKAVDAFIKVGRKHGVIE